MPYRKVYVGKPMDRTISAAMRVMKYLGMDRGEFRVEYSFGLPTLYVVAEKAPRALDTLVEAEILSLDDAWTYFISTPVELP